LVKLDAVLLRLLLLQVLQSRRRTASFGWQMN
jgi:hypothetical protein